MKTKFDLAIDSGRFYRIITNDEEFGKSILRKLRKNELKFVTCLRLGPKNTGQYEFNHILPSRVDDLWEGETTSIELWTHSKSINTKYNVLVFGYDDKEFYFSN